MATRLSFQTRLRSMILIIVCLLSLVGKISSESEPPRKFLDTDNSDSDSTAIIETDVRGILAAFGDFDSDKLTDAFIISPNRRSFNILRGYNKEPLLRNHKSWNCTLPGNSPDDEKIVALMPSDFHGMAMMDVLVVTSKGDEILPPRFVPPPVTESEESQSEGESNHLGDGSNKRYKIYLVRGNKESLACEMMSQELFNVSNEPLLMDYNGDMITDIMASDPDEGDQRTIWLFKFNATFIAKPAFGGKRIKQLNSNSFIDLNSDTIPDVYIDSADNDRGEYWLNEKDGFGNKKPSIIIPRPDNVAYLGSSIFTDITSDGKITHIKPVITQSDQISKLIYFLDGEWLDLTGQLIDPADNSSLSFISDQIINGLIIPMAIRSADFDGDGFFDFVTILKNSKTGKSKVYILKNIPNSSSSDFILDKELEMSSEIRKDNNNNQLKSKRTFEILNLDIILPEDEEPFMVSFFDFFENGKVDLIINARKPNSDKSQPNSYTYTLHGIINSGYTDSGFLKVMVASGLCYADCSAITGDNNQPNFDPAIGNNKEIAYGTNQPGSIICHELIDWDGYVRKICQGQLTSSAHFTLQMPYTIFGLGNWPNFVDQISATIPSPNSTSKRMRNWTQIVPDAQVVLIPYPKDKPSFWRHKLFLTPSDIVLSTLITLASICILLIVVIAFLHRKEILEDIAEHEEYKRHWPDSR